MQGAQGTSGLLVAYGAAAAGVLVGLLIGRAPVSRILAFPLIAIPTSIGAALLWGALSAILRQRLGDTLLIHLGMAFFAVTGGLFSRLIAKTRTFSNPRRGILAEPSSQRPTSLLKPKGRTIAGLAVDPRDETKCLTVIDEYTRESLAIDVAGSIRSGRLIEGLSKLVSEHGAPKYRSSDNSAGFISKAVLKQLLQSNMDNSLMVPGKPWQNGADESFNRKFRDECLSLDQIRNRTEAKIVIEHWRRHYNVARPHSSLSCLTPVEFKSPPASLCRLSSIAKAVVSGCMLVNPDLRGPGASGESLPVRYTEGIPGPGGPVIAVD